MAFGGGKLRNEIMAAIQTAALFLANPDCLKESSAHRKKLATSTEYRARSARDDLHVLRAAFRALHLSARSGNKAGSVERLLDFRSRTTLRFGTFAAFDLLGADSSSSILSPSFPPRTDGSWASFIPISSSGPPACTVAADMPNTSTAKSASSS